MVLMAIDHSSDAFNAGRLFTDAARHVSPRRAAAGGAVPHPLDHPHLRADVSLPGRHQPGLHGGAPGGEGRRPAEIDRYIFVRGVIIAAFELWIPFSVMGRGASFRSSTASGPSYVLMVALRRLPDRLAGALALR